MELTSLGFNEWFEERAVPVLQPGQRMARITAVDRGAFLIQDEDGEIHAELAGKFRFETQAAGDLPCVGDWVCVQRDSLEGSTIIHGVLPRKTFLRRKRADETVSFQMIAANIDIAFIVQSCHYDFNVARLERYIVMANEGQVEPQIILTKTDLISQGELDERIEAIRCRDRSVQILPLSNETGAGLTEFEALLLPGKTYCLLGSSGVGKTTIINRLIRREAFETQAVSSTGEGVHTTSRRYLLILEGGSMLIDTPGMRGLGLLGTSEGIDTTFAAIGDYSTHCRFPDCTHIREPGCAVLVAVKNGALSEDQYQSYLKLKQETKSHDLTDYAKRKKDREFGRLVKSAQKRMKAQNSGTDPEY